MKTIKFLPLLFLAYFLNACGGEEKPGDETTTPLVEEQASGECLYSYDPTSTKMGWVAYKFAQKTGVNGRFDGITVEGVKDAKTAAAMVENATFSIQIPTIQTGDPTRDVKILDQFFGHLAPSQELTGRVLSVRGSETEGSVVFTITLNAIEKEVTGNYIFKEGVLEVMADINVNDWKAEKALADLNKVCEDLHRGTDGKSVLWPDVKIFVSTTPKKGC